MRKVSELHAQTPHHSQQGLFIDPQAGLSRKASEQHLLTPHQQQTPHQLAPTVSIITDDERRYFRLGRIGKGAFKEVYKALDEVDGIEVAWNEVDLTHCDNANNVEREVELLQRMHHPHVIRCFTSWIDRSRNTLVFITELMTSGTLSQFMALQSGKAFRKQVALRYGRQILCGVAYLHQEGLIHRDLKCSNIFINANKGEVKIGDLGLSIATRSATSVTGTPEYMAPEMYTEQYTNAVDMWSFGLCMLEMIRGKRPYHECENVAQVFKKVSQGMLPDMTNIDDFVLEDAIKRCLQLEATQRIDAETLLKHDAFRIPADECDFSGSSDEATLENSSMVKDMLHPDHAKDLLDQERPLTATTNCTATTNPNTGNVFLNLSDKACIVQWLKHAPKFTQAEVVQFAVARGWIDAKEERNIMLSSHGTDQEPPASAASSMRGGIQPARHLGPFDSLLGEPMTQLPQPLQTAQHGATMNGSSIGGSSHQQVLAGSRESTLSPSHVSSQQQSPMHRTKSTVVDSAVFPTLVVEAPIGGSSTSDAGHAHPMHVVVDPHELGDGQRSGLQSPKRQVLLDEDDPEEKKRRALLSEKKLLAQFNSNLAPKGAPQSLAASASSLTNSSGGEGGSQAAPSAATSTAAPPKSLGQQLNSNISATPKGSTQVLPGGGETSGPPTSVAPQPNAQVPVAPSFHSPSTTTLAPPASASSFTLQ